MLKQTLNIIGKSGRPVFGAEIKILSTKSQDVLPLAFTSFFSDDIRTTDAKKNELFCFGVALKRGRILTLISVRRPRMKTKAIPERSIVHRTKVIYRCRPVGEGSLIKRNWGETLSHLSSLLNNSLIAFEFSLSLHK